MIHAFLLALSIAGPARAEGTAPPLVYEGEALRDAPADYAPRPEDDPEAPKWPDSRQGWVAAHLQR